MHKSQLRRSLVSISCAALLVAGIGQGPAQAGPRPSDPRAATTHVRSITLRTTTKSLALLAAEDRWRGGGEPDRERHAAALRQPEPFARPQVAGARGRSRPGGHDDNAVVAADGGADSRLPTRTRGA